MTDSSASAAVLPARGGVDRLRLALFAALPLALAAGTYVYATGGAVMSTDNAYVQADMVAVSTDVSGLVKSVDVQENQPVAAGQVLFRLDDLPFRLALQRADMKIETARNDLLADQANYRDLQAQIQRAQADIAYYANELERKRQLVNTNTTPRSAFDDARHDAQTAQLKLASLIQQGTAMAARLDGRPGDDVETYPAYRDAVAARDEAQRQLDHTVVRAPMAGVVTRVPSLQVGQALPAATPAFSLVATDHVWIDAQPKETELTWVHAGQPVAVTVDTYPGTVWHGTVDSISPASGASLSLLPAQNSSGNWVKVVQRIPVRVRIDTSADLPPLRVGMSATVEVETGHVRGLPFGGDHG
ncbi:HlyD family secretion protein [Novispirillum itersonii]|uniref:Membrane fusion protein (Multidrug efflux system) n=1 Tax=Novispirillum itersonii TaxID=189 RepID=A0A7W9ZIG8_NOVIT|nr:HlyD family secretion protein [Novispirillum itersonii]MBB6211648.1 membrane fusion protein (multidrug efflux system) [Novispirillum itersonii]